MSQYGRFYNFCRDTGNTQTTLVPCNLFLLARDTPTSNFAPGCQLQGIPLGGGQRLANLGSIILDGIAILVAAFLFFRSNRKRAAVGRREMQLFLIGYMIISICEVFTVGGFPLNTVVRRIFTAIHIAAVTATTWILMINGAVGYQLLDDGTPLSLGLLFGSAAALFVGTGYIALDTGFRWTGFFDSTLSPANGNQAYAIYTLYLLVPLVFIALYFILETFLVLRVLGEFRPMLYLVVAAVLFAIGQVFQFVVSVYICNGTNGAINGGFIQVLFNLLSVVAIWVFWSSITEDDWPIPVSGGSTYT